MLNYGDYYETPVFIKMPVKYLFSSIVNVALIQRMELWGCDQEELENISLSRKFVKKREYLGLCWTLGFMFTVSEIVS